MKQRIVGIYNIGFEQAQLVLREGDGGEFYLCPDVGRVPQIAIGADQELWQDVVDVLVHEVVEFAMLREGCRYSPAPDHAKDHGSYLFVMTHSQFSSVAAKSGGYLTAALPDLAKAWDGWNKERKKKEREK